MDYIDHIVLNSGNNIDNIVKYFHRMGFIITPRGYHSTGSINHIIVLNNNYLELLAYPGDNLSSNRSELSQMPIGLMSTVIKTNDADKTQNKLIKNGFIPRPTLNLSRPIDLENGITTDVKFRVIYLEPNTISGTNLYYCQHITPELVWRSIWQTHNNACFSMIQLIINVNNPKEVAQIYMRAINIIKFDNSGENCCIIYLENFQIILMNVNDKPLGMFKLVFATHSLEKVINVLTQGKINYQIENKRICADTFIDIGCILEFQYIE